VTMLAPGWTDYRQRIAYQTYDVTGLLRPGGNVLGAILADGWYSGFMGFDAKHAGGLYGTAPELLAQLLVRFAGGGETWVLTDPEWRVTSGAIRHADLLMGERHEQALEPGGWDRPGFDARGWPTVACRDRDSAPLVADPGPPVRVTQELPARSVGRDAAGRFIADFGQNLTGWLRLRVDGPDPACVRIRHAEVLDRGDVLWIDTGINLNGYSSDFGATWIVGGEPDAYAHSQFARWRDTVDRVLEVAKPGATAQG